MTEENKESAPEKGPEEEFKPKYVSLNVRMFASFIDCTLIFLIMWYGAFVFKPIYGLAYHITGAEADLYGFNVRTHGITSVSKLIDAVIEFGLMKKIIVNGALSFFIYGLMIVPFWWKYGGTPGKMLIRATIVDAKTFGTPSKMQFIIRYLAYALSCIPLFLGVLFTGIDRKKQSLHDKIAGTAVIYVKDPWKFFKFPKPEPKKVLDIYKEMFEEFKSK